jgi:hypothetical protein
MVKDKLQNYGAQKNFDDYENINMNEIKDLYERSLNHITKTKNDIDSQMDLYYLSFVRRDPFRPYYNY